MDPSSSSSSATASNHIKWPDFFMAIVFLAAKRSKDRIQVGACIVNRGNKIVGIGYNGMPKRCDKKLFHTSSYVCHAELNAVLNKTTADLEDCTMYVGLFPCKECAKAIIQSGIKEIRYLWDKDPYTEDTMGSKAMLDAANVKYSQHFTTISQISIDFHSDLMKLADH